MLALVTRDGMVANIYLPQLQGLIRAGLWQLSLTTPKKNAKLGKHFDAVLYNTGKRRADSGTTPSSRWPEFAINSLPDQGCWAAIVPLCPSGLRNMFGIIPDRIYLTFLKETP